MIATVCHTAFSILVVCRGLSGLFHMSGQVGLSAFGGDGCQFPLFSFAQVGGELSDVVVRFV